MRRNDEQSRKGCRDRPPCLSDALFRQGQPQGVVPTGPSPVGSIRRITKPGVFQQPPKGGAFHPPLAPPRVHGHARRPPGANFTLRYAASPLLRVRKRGFAGLRRLLRVRRSGGLHGTRRGIAPHRAFSTAPRTTLPVHGMRAAPEGMGGHTGPPARETGFFNSLLPGRD